MKYFKSIVALIILSVAISSCSKSGVYDYNCTFLNETTTVFTQEGKEKDLQALCEILGKEHLDYRIELKLAEKWAESSAQIAAFIGTASQLENFITLKEQELLELRQIYETGIANGTAYVLELERR